MIVRGHFREEFLEIKYDQRDGIEILEAQMGSLNLANVASNCEVVLIDFAGRQIQEPEDLEDVKVVEITESGPPDGIPATFDPVVPSMDDLFFDLPPSPPPSSPMNRASRSSSRNKVVVTNSVAEVWCLDSRLVAEDTAFCTADLFPATANSQHGRGDAPLVQPRYRIVDTDILVCSHCRLFLDSSLVVFEPVPLAAFVCQGKRAAEMGLLYPESSSGSERIFSLTETEASGPVGLFMKRLLLQRAIDAQPASALGGGGGGLPTAAASAAQGLEAQMQQLVLTQARIKAEKEMEARLRSGLQTVWAHEDADAAAAARAAVDYDKVREFAQRHLQAHEGCAEDVAMLVGLLHWFKGGFFQWVTKPACDNSECPAKLPHTDPGWRSGTIESRGVVPPSAEEVEVGGAGRTEIYWCTACESTLRFPRFTRPAHLLKWRRGRCGEFANAFCLICRSLSLDTRWVLDFTDHVWAEVWVPSMGRYVHIDPCERTMDTPLMYEQGWGKQLTYVVSFSRHGVLDATPRYTRRLAEVLERRGALGAGDDASGGGGGGGGGGGYVSERLFAECLRALDSEQEARFLSASRDSRPSALATASSSTSTLHLSLLEQGSTGFQALAAADSSIMTIRRRKRLLAKELRGVTLESRHEWKLEEMRGRISGDKSWKEARGEAGSTSSSTSSTAVAVAAAAVATTSSASSFNPPANEWVRARIVYVPLGGGTHGDTAPFDLCAASSLWTLLSSLADHPAELAATWASLRLAELSVWSSSSLLGGLQCTYDCSTPAASSAVAPTALAALVLGSEDAPMQNSLAFAQGEKITRVSARCGALVDAIRVTTSAGREISAGGTGGTETVFEVPEDLFVLGFYGGKGGHIHNIGLILGKM